MGNKTNNKVSRITSHYAMGDLQEKIKRALEDEGLDLGSLSVEDSAPVDEFHIRGREATREIVQKIDLKSTDVVLDAGAGIGETARYLADERNCKVIGIDLTPEYVKVAKWLNEKILPDNPPEFIEGDVANMPFEDSHFDAVITEHVNMNIEDKSTFISEVCRILKPGGKVGFYEILAGPNRPAAYPVPWSETGETSFLVSQDKIKDLFKEEGFKVLSWEATTNKGLKWYQDMVKARKKDGPPSLGIHLYLGKLAPEMFKNLGKNLQEERIKVVQVVLQK